MANTHESCFGLNSDSDCIITKIMIFIILAAQDDVGGPGVQKPCSDQTCFTANLLEPNYRLYFAGSFDLG